MNTLFLPSLHGFRFINRFSGYPLPLLTALRPKLPQWLQNPKVAYGLCGGMASAAWDFYVISQEIPGAIAVPEPGTPLYRYLFRRQLDTYGTLGHSVGKFATWMALSDRRVQALSAQELTRIQKQLHQGQAAVLGLVYVSFAQTLAIWVNHQVLVYGYSEVADTVMLHIYDPNFPGRDDIAIAATPTATGWHYRQIIPGRSDRPLRGFFVMPYQPVTPPLIVEV